MENTNLGAYGKSITYIAVTAMAFLVTALSDNSLSLEEGINLGVVVVGAIGVYIVPNFPNSVAKFAKSGIAFVTAALVALLSFLSDGVTTTEWLQIGLAALAAIGVYIVPNTLPKAVQAVEIVAVAPEAAATPVATEVPVLTGPISDIDIDGKTGKLVD